MSDEHFPDEQDREQPSRNALASDVQEAGLRAAKLTDHRDFDTVWSNDEGLCQRLLMEKPATWRTAIQRYWRQRCKRPELASELGLDLETAKNLLRRIRKAARDFQNGTTRRLAREDVQYPGRPHCGINTRDIEAICDGDPEAVAHIEEYRRLDIIERLNMFSSAITGELIKTLQHSDAIGDSQREDITSRLIAKADALKAKTVKPDPFTERPLFSIFPDQRTSMRIPEIDENGDVRWKVRIIGRSEAEPIKRGRPRPQTKPATITPKRRGRKQIPISDLRVVPFPPPVSHGRSFYVAGSVSHQ